MHRTTILLDEASHAAAKKLAGHLKVTPSEAMRRAILAYQTNIFGTKDGETKKRKDLLRRLIKVSEGDPAAELRQRKAEEESW